MLEQSAELPDTNGSPTTHDSLWRDCVESFAQSAAEKPLTAVAQIADHLVGTSLAEHVHFVGKPEERNAGSFGWIAEQVASGAGSVIPFTLSALAFKPLAARMVGTPLLATSLSAERVASLNAVAESTFTGFGMGFLLTPTAENKNFWKDKFVDGITGATTFGSMHAFSNGLGSWTKANSFNAGIGIRALNTSIAGAGAGLVGAETQARLTTGDDATMADLSKSAISMGVSGGVLGAAGDSLLKLNQSKSNFPALQEYLGRHFQDQEASFEEYLGHQASKSVFDWPKLLRREQESYVNPALKLSQLSSLERIDAITKLERNATSALAQPEIVSDFVAKMRSVSLGWEGDQISLLSTRALEAQENYEKECESFFRQKESNSKDKAQLAESEAKLELERKIRDEHLARYDEVNNRRESEIATAINQFLEKHKLPAVKIEIKSNHDAAGTYYNGHLTLGDHIMQSDSIDPAINETLFHELTHLEQQNLNFRWLADKLNIDSTATPEQIDEMIRTNQRDPHLVETPENSAEFNEFRAFVRQILRHRNGQRLAPDEVARAANLDKAASAYDAPWKQQQDALDLQSTEIGLALEKDDTTTILGKIASGRIEADDLPDALKPLVEKAKSNEENAWLFHSSEAADSFEPIEDDFDATKFMSEIEHNRDERTKRVDAWLSDNEKNMIRNYLLTKEQAINSQFSALSRRSYRWYLNNGEEQEAHAGGILTHLTAINSR